MNFKEMSHQEISDFIINDPALCYMGFNDAELVEMYESGKYPLRQTSYYIGLEENDKILCVLKWEYFTHHCISIHPYMATKHQKKGNLTKIYNFLYKHFIDNTEIRKVIALVPSCCDHTIKACKRHGFKVEGKIKRCHMWRQKLVNIFIFGLDLKEDMTLIGEVI